MHRVQIGSTPLSTIRFGQRERHSGREAAITRRDNSRYEKYARVDEIRVPQPVYQPGFLQST